jgi:succinoglycan biosynthesis transport protein ExoP
VTLPDQPVAIDYRAIVRRRKWSLIVPFVGGAIAAAALVTVLPREYVARATLAVASPSVSGGLTAGSQLDLAERIRAVSHELLSQPVVEQVARDERLLDHDSLDDVVADVRRRTTVALPERALSPQSGRFEPDTFIVSYMGQTAELSARVANRLTDVFVESHSKIREARAEGTSTFLEQQVEASRAKLDQAENRLRDAKSSYQGRLPEQTLANLQSVSELRQRGESDAQALRTERERLTRLEQQLAEMKQDAETKSREAVGKESRERLAALEKQLAEAQLQYTPKHPEIQRLETEVTRARAEEAEASRNGRPAAVPADPVYRQLQSESETARMRIRDLEAAQMRTESTVQQYQARLDQAPMIEQQLMSLSQTYDFEKQQYQKLAERLETARLNENLERKGAGEQFIVLYRAEVPARPSSPNVPLVIAFSLLAGLAAGIGLAVIREFLDRTVHDRRTLQQEFERPVLAEIPHF